VLSSVHLAVIRLQQATAEQHRQVFEGLRAAGIGVQLHYSPVHLQPYYRAIGFAEGQFPEAEAYASSAISLPLFPGLSKGDQERVAAMLAETLEAVAADMAA
jgi:dTDP-4-amino-4,6-dideoxygalactose transaminase